MPNTKISQDTTVAYKATLLCPAVDMTLPAGTQNVNVLASSLTGVSAAMRPATTAATALLGWNVLAGAGIISNNNPIAFGPCGNAWATMGSLVVQATTQSATLREFAGAFGLESTMGHGGVGPAGGIAADKVALYAGIEGFAGSGDIWALNILTRMVSGFPSDGNALGLELDFNNESGARGAVDGLAGFAGQFGVGLLVTGAGTYGSTAAFSVQGASNATWYRGMGVASGVTQAAFYDYSFATAGIEMQATHAWGIDMLYSSLGGAIRTPNGGGIYARNANNTADIALINADAGNNLEIGVTAGGTNQPGGIYMGTGVLPFSDNAFALGTSTRRWTTVYASTGTINTSDPTLKTDIADVPDCLPIIMALQPKTYRWIVGGMDMTDVEEEQTLQVMEPVEYDGFEIEVVDGKATRIPVRKQEMREAYDEVPLLDEAGQQVIVHVPAREEVRDLHGKILTPAQPAKDVPQVHRIPRMEKRTVTAHRLRPREGRRTHWGFMAPDIKKAFEPTGLDFAGYVKTEDGTEANRPDQMLPVVVKALQELKAELDALKASMKAA